MATIQERIKERRNATGFTLLEVAELLGVKEATVQRYESGEIKNIKHDTIVEMAKIFRCTPQYLMGWSDMVTEPASIENLNYFLHSKVFKNDNDIILISCYQDLNKKGKRKLIDYAQDLIKIDEYTNNEK